MIEHDKRFDPQFYLRLGITKFMVQGGLVEIKTVRDANGNPENAYVKVCTRLVAFLRSFANGFS